MKRVLAMLLVTGLLFACGSGSDEEKSRGTDTPGQNHKEKPAGLVLNNGAKWKADSTTLLNVALLQHKVSSAKKESLDNYLQIAAALQDSLDKMVSECKMKGADHEALHHWLEPLIEKTKELKNAGSIENAETISREIEKQINLFQQYFEK